MRKAVGVVVGIILANLVILGWELLLQHLPFGRVIDPTDMVRPGVVAAIPLAAKLWVVAGYALGTFAGALLAFRAGRWDFAGWIVAGVIAALGIVNGLQIPQPLWMELCAVADPFVGALFAFGLWRRSKAADWRAAQS